jgi:response regulator RpfG family c-di-GMP phosphodiesterase
MHMAEQLQPDLILLDIGLPKLNGLDAARRIRMVAPVAKILCVSENRSRDIADAALANGAGGYVVKSDAGNDLLPAIRAVLRGERFISSSLTGDNSIGREPARHEKVAASSGRQSTESNTHALRLSENDAAFVDSFVQSIEATLETGNAVVVIATESHRTRILQKLSSRGVDVSAAIERRLLMALDAADSLSTFMVEDTLTDEDRSANGIPHVIVEAAQTAKERHRHVAVG